MVNKFLDGSIIALLGINNRKRGATAGKYGTETKHMLTYSPRLKPGDSGVEQELPSRDGLTFPNPTDDAPPVLS